MTTYIHHGSIVDRFHSALIGRQIPGVAPRPATAEDAFELYRAWCEREGLPSLDSSSTFVRVLCARKDVLRARKRYAMDGFILGPHCILYFTGPLPTRWGVAADILGEEINRFRADLRRFDSTNVREHAAQVPERVR